MGRIVAAGHISFDLTPVIPGDRLFERVDQVLFPGCLLHTRGISVTAGGSVSNTGLALRAIGEDAALVSKIGRDEFGGMLSGILKSHGAGGGLIDSASDRTSYTVVLNFPGINRMFLHDPGANDTFCAEDVPDETLKGAAILHFGYPPLMRRMGQPEEMKKLLLRARRLGVATSLDMAMIDPDTDTDWEAYLREVLPLVDFFVPSFEELCCMTDLPRWKRLSAGGQDVTLNLDLDGEAMPLAQRMLDMGCAAVLVKCGVSGMVYATAGEGRLRETGRNLGLDVRAWARQEGKVDSFPAGHVVSATGAGDVSIAAFLAAVRRGLPPRRCALLASAEGACSVRTMDPVSGLLPLDKLAEIIDNNRWKEEIACL